MCDTNANGWLCTNRDAVGWICTNCDAIDWYIVNDKATCRHCGKQYTIIYSVDGGTNTDE